MNKLTVYKLDENGNEVWHYVGLELERNEHLVRLKAYFNRDDIDMGFTIFARGDRFVESFYNDRWYNIFAVYEGESSKFKGWYCNVCRPALLGESTVRCEDLALDVWVTPEGKPLVLDEAEFAALKITAEDRVESLNALEELLQLARSGDLPR
ncbi:MAG: DUF402 domain-containing protein [Candidatus Promineifilaceae bacterium]